MPLEKAPLPEARRQTTAETQRAIKAVALQSRAEVWQIQDIQAAMDEARQGDFASEPELSALMARYGA